LISTWQDARLYAAAAGVAAYFWRRGVLTTILVGMAVYLPLRLGLGW
jgi:branched-subunit amino acid transport protein